MPMARLMRRFTATAAGPCQLMGMSVSLRDGLGCQAAEGGLHIAGFVQAVESSTVAEAWPLIEEVVQRVVGQRDVEGPARLRNQEGIEANAPGAGVVGHHEEHVARDKAGAPVVLVQVVGVRRAAVAVAVGKGESVEARQVEVLADLGVDAGDQLILLEDRLRDNTRYRYPPELVCGVPPVAWLALRVTI